MATTPIRIDNPNDPRLKNYVNLRQSRAASERSLSSETFIAEGHLVVRRLIQSEYEVESLLVQEGKGAEYCSALPARVPVYTMPAPLMNQVVGFEFHRGVMACGRRQPFGTTREFAAAGIQRRLAIGLLGITEQENLGSILRTAAALGVDQIMIGPNTIDPFSRRVIRVSMATVFKHRFYRLVAPDDDLRRLADSGIRTIASTIDQSAIPAGEWVADQRDMLLLVGNEARGIDQDIQELVSDCIRIPMHFGIDSLNAAVAAAILMYQLTVSK
ncbi:MAG: RNA methyltransferase [Pirellulaceae bacterium]|nr:RNA methyltransferase [Pirellulaceae bacterium]